IPKKRTGVPEPPGDGEDAAESAHPRGRVRTPPGQSAPVAELPIVVLPPALHRAVRLQDRTGVIEPAGDGNSTPERGSTSADLHGGGTTLGGPVAELPLVVPSPALHCAVRKQRTGVITPSGDGLDVVGTADSAHLHRGVRTEDRRGGTWGGSWEWAASARRGGAELPVGVPPPAPDRAVHKERTGMIAAGGDGAGTRERSSTSAHHLVRIGLGSVEIPVAALPGV